MDPILERGIDASPREQLLKGGIAQYRTWPVQ